MSTFSDSLHWSPVASRRYYWLSLLATELPTGDTVSNEHSVKRTTFGHWDQNRPAIDKYLFFFFSIFANISLGRRWESSVAGPARANFFPR